jgi:hypothetical protein
MRFSIKPGFIFSVVCLSAMFGIKGMSVYMGAQQNNEAKEHLKPVFEKSIKSCTTFKFSKQKSACDEKLTSILETYSSLREDGNVKAKKALATEVDSIEFSTEPLKGQCTNNLLPSAYFSSETRKINVSADATIPEVIKSLDVIGDWLKMQRPIGMVELEHSLNVHTTDDKKLQTQKCSLK